MTNLALQIIRQAELLTEAGNEKLPAIQFADRLRAYLVATEPLIAEYRATEQALLTNLSVRDRANWS